MAQCANIIMEIQKQGSLTAICQIARGSSVSSSETCQLRRIGEAHVRGGLQKEKKKKKTGGRVFFPYRG